MSGHGKCQSYIHAAGISLYRRIYELLNARKSNDLVKFFDHFPFPHSQDRSIQEYILPSGQLRVEACSYLQQARDSALYFNFSFCRTGYTGKYFQQGGLTSAVLSDYADHISLFHFKGDIVESMEFPASRSPGIEPYQGVGIFLFHQSAKTALNIPV